MAAAQACGSAQCNPVVSHSALVTALCSGYTERDGRVEAAAEEMLQVVRMDLVTGHEAVGASRLKVLEMRRVRDHDTVTAGPETEPSIFELSFD